MSQNSYKNKQYDLSVLTYGKTPPQAIEFEEAVLGAIMLEQESQDLVFDIITKPEVFYLSTNQLIFEAIKALYDSSAPIDLLTVTEQLRRLGQLDNVGGAYRLTMLTTSVLTSAHVESHARILVEKYLSREMIRISAKAATQSFDDVTDIFDLMDAVGNEINNLTSDIIRKEPVPTAKSAVTVMQEIDEQSQQNVPYTGITTGFKELDAKTSGWQKSDVIILAARPSVGKTSLVISFLINAATAGSAVAFFSLEMSQKQIVIRMLASISGVEISQIANPSRMTADERERVKNASMILAALPIFIDDTAGLNHVQLRSKARKLKKKNKVELIAIDYLQLMEPVEKGMPREQQVSQNSRKIKILAKDLELPIIALSQLNRGIENDKNRTPNLSDLRESGAIEQDADIVMFLSNPTPALISKMPIFSGKILLNIEKGRSIGLGNIPLEFNKDLQRWRDVDRSGHYPAVSSDQLSYEEKKANKALAAYARDIVFPQVPEADLPF